MEKSRATETILTITLAFVIIFMLTKMEHIWMLYAAIAIGIPGLFLKWLRIIIHIFWFWMAEKMGFVMSRLILSIVFILFLIPFGFLARIFRKDLMFMNRGEGSYYKKRLHHYSGDDLENPW